jgi:peptidoglycan/LPS O-acetylase OafA/YrhL
VWPWVVSWLRPAHLGPVLLAGILPAAALAACTTCALLPPEQVPTVLQYETWYRSLALAAGSLLALVERRRGAEPPAPQPGPFVSTRVSRRRLLGLVGAMLTLAFLLSETHLGILLPTGYAPLSGGYAPVLPLHFLPACKLVSFTLACTALLLLAANARLDGPPGRWLASAPLRGIGRISYGLYLYHYPIYHALLGPAPTAAQAGLAIGASLVAAILSYVCLERPILTFAARYR